MPIENEIEELRNKVNQITENEELRVEIKRSRGRQDAYAGSLPTELTGPYFSEYKKIRKKIQKDNS